MITKINNKVVVGALTLLFPLSTFLFTSCEDFFEQESDDVLYADQEHLNNAVDSIYSVTGIMNKLQVIADRTILLGEVRGDLVTLTENASSDLRELSEFNVSSDNKYNSPRDYYDIINNCNYFITHVEKDLKNNRNEYVFMKEYAAVKAFRAWTYMQLAQVYGKVPFVTEPILSKDEAEQDYPMYTMEDICRYFIDDLSTIPEEYNRDYPGYRSIRGVNSRFFYFPLSILRGELYLWLASITHDAESYRQAALNYYKYISERNGTGGYYAPSLTLVMWAPGSSSWTSYYLFNHSLGGGPSYFGSDGETYDAQGELITMIPGDSIPAEGYYSELRNLFNYTDLNDGKFSITPSKGMQEISESQENCCVSKIRSDGLYSVYKSPKGLSNLRSGDLRLRNIWVTGTTTDAYTGERVDVQMIMKYQTRNVRIYRRQMVYLRMAEALNGAGYPRMAFQILSQGLNDKVIKQDVYPYYSKEDSLSFISKFSFPTSQYVQLQVENFAGSTVDLKNANTIGMHTRGSGWTPDNEDYQFPDSAGQKQTITVGGVSKDTVINVAVPVATQQAYVDSLILNESALELSFEGTRFYDVMRYALRQTNPGATMKQIICNRRGKDNAATVQGEIKKDLTNQQNWYLNWNGKIGY